MGASGWSYYTPYQEDLDAALKTLWRKVFTEGDYWWARSETSDRPATLKELFADEWVQESGTHSILDVFDILTEGDEHKFGTVKPVTRDEALAHAGTEVLTREHVPSLDQLPLERWQGRCAVLHDAHSQPSEIYFWGISGY